MNCVTVVDIPENVGVPPQEMMQSSNVNMNWRAGTVLDALLYISRLPLLATSMTAYTPCPCS